MRKMAEERRLRVHVSQAPRSRLPISRHHMGEARSQSHTTLSAMNRFV